MSILERTQVTHSDLSNKGIVALSAPAIGHLLGERPTAGSDEGNFRLGCTTHDEVKIDDRVWDENAEPGCWQIQNKKRDVGQRDRTIFRGCSIRVLSLELAVVTEPPTGLPG